MLQPKKSKYRKQFKGRIKGLSLRGCEISFGDFGLKATTRGFVSARQLEAARKKITFATKRTGKYWLRVFPDKPLTKKPVGVKMGSGKGDIDQYVAPVLPGRIIYEIGGVPEDIAKEALRKAAQKLSVRTIIVAK